MNPSTIAGVTITPLRQIGDERGSVLHMLRNDSPGFLGFGECYFSEIKPGVIKAWKRHLRQTQNLAVPVGRVRFVIADQRAGSATCGAIEIVELGRPDNYSRVTIPPLVWYGFAALGPVSGLVANCADMPHEPGESEAVPVENFGDGRALALLRSGLAPP